MNDSDNSLQLSCRRKDPSHRSDKRDACYVREGQINVPRTGLSLAASIDPFPSSTGESDHGGQEAASRRTDRKRNCHRRHCEEERQPPSWTQGGLHVHDFNLEVLRFAVSVSELTCKKSLEMDTTHDSYQRRSASGQCSGSWRQSVA